MIMQSQMEYKPPKLLQNPHLQNYLVNTTLRTLLVNGRSGPGLAQAKSVVLSCGNGVRLQGFYSGSSTAEHMVTILHGREGSARSGEVLSLSQALLDAGFAVFRLNLRDHGDTHHLNLKLFNSTLIEEVVNALKAIQQQYHYKHYSLAGFSLGGNFALRAALRGTQLPSPLKRVFAVCPVINPKHSINAVHKAPFFYERHLVNRWRRSLLKKAAAFPQYRFGRDLRRMRTWDEMNHYFIPRFTGYNNIAEYYSAYDLTGQKLATLRTPTTIILSEDDPLVPFEDLQTIARPECLSVVTSRHGGHCAFLDSYGLKSWVDKYMVATLHQELGVAEPDGIHQSV